MSGGLLTIRHREGGPENEVDAFIDGEVRTYTPQLARYAALWRAWSDEPVRCALYFPALPPRKAVRPDPCGRARDRRIMAPKAVVVEVKDGRLFLGRRAMSDLAMPRWQLPGPPLLWNVVADPFASNLALKSGQMVSGDTRKSVMPIMVEDGVDESFPPQHRGESLDGGRKS